MRTLSICLLLVCGVETFLLYEANKAFDSVDFYVEQEAEAAYRYACMDNTTNKSVIQCGMEAVDYTRQFITKE